MTRNTDLDNLHPVVRQKVKTLIDKLAHENIPLRLFEGYRNPERQHQLFSQGRTSPGPRVTKADAWQSYHQYGVACDFVLYIDGKWSWNTGPKFKKYWARYHELGAEVGLKPISWEKPHLELQNLNLQELVMGNYPEGGDESWSENLSSNILQWTKGPTPPPPRLLFNRPELPSDEIDEEITPPIGITPHIHSIVQTGSTYRVTARNGLYMRAGPGTDFDILGTLLANRSVVVTKKSGQWYQVDLQNDGLVDGYCHSGFLVRVI